MSETIEKVLRQLEAQGESIDEQRVLIQQIISKYPPEVVTKLEETKEPLRPWSRCLCPQKFPRQETDALLVTEPGQIIF